MPRRLLMPERRMASMMGRTVAAKRSASAIETVRPRAAALAGLVGLPNFLPEVLREAGPKSPASLASDYPIRRIGARAERNERRAVW